MGLTIAFQSSTNWTINGKSHLSSFYYTIAGHYDMYWVSNFGAHHFGAAIQHSKNKFRPLFQKNCKNTNIKARLGLTYPLTPLKETTFKVSYGVIKQWLVLRKNKGFVYADSLLNYIPLRTKITILRYTLYNVIMSSNW